MTGTRFLPALSDLVEVVLIELPDETREIAMLEILRKDILRELFILERWLCQPGGRTHERYKVELLTSSTTKLSPQSPHRMTLLNWPLCNILYRSNQYLDRLSVVLGNFERLPIQLPNLRNVSRCMGLLVSSSKTNKIRTTCAILRSKIVAIHRCPSPHQSSRDL